MLYVNYISIKVEEKQRATLNNTGNNSNMTFKHLHQGSSRLFGTGLPLRTVPQGTAHMLNTQGAGPMLPGEHCLPSSPWALLPGVLLCAGSQCREDGAGQEWTLACKHQVLGQAECSDTAYIQSPTMRCFTHDYD